MGNVLEYAFFISWAALCSVYRFKKKLLGVMHWFHGCYVSLSHAEYESEVKKRAGGLLCCRKHCSDMNLHIGFFIPYGNTEQKIRESFSSPPWSDWCSCFLAMGSYDKLGLY